MLENKEKFYIYDRWFYLIKETDDKITYSSLPDNIEDGMILEMEKETHKVDILALQDGRLLAKLYISDITKKEINYHYKETEPQEIIIDDDIYVNLLLEAFIETKYGRIDKESLIRISKKKNLNKICYRIPPIPLDKDIYLDKYKIKSEMLTYFLNLIDSFSVYTTKIKEYVEEPMAEEKEIELNRNITNLNIPDEIYMYDRKYTFVEKESNHLSYENNQGELSKLSIELDPNYYFLTGITLNRITKQNITYFLEAKYDKLNQVVVKFNNLSKSKIRLSYTEAIETLFNYEAEFNKERKLTHEVVKLERNNTLLTLSRHPYFSNTYVDQHGNEYKLCSQDFSELSGIANYAPAILENIEKSLVKKES